MTITTMGRYRFYSDLPVTILLNKITHCAHQLKLQTYNVYQQNFNIKTKKNKKKKKQKKKNEKQNKKKIIFRWWGLNELPISLTIAMTNKCCICDLNHSAMILGLFTSLYIRFESKGKYSIFHLLKWSHYKTGYTR